MPDARSGMAKKKIAFLRSSVPEAPDFSAAPFRFFVDAGTVSGSPKLCADLLERPAGRRGNQGRGSL
jgi:hypothetical protein